jgi:demethylmenaquinone methyltransferase/2-methoxy-6-polyprenyl-1,4-benzoquinol methylase
MWIKKTRWLQCLTPLPGRYDFLNRFLSAGIDKSWRKKAIKELKEFHPKLMLDVATGTGDVAIVACKLLNPDKIIGIDISEGMLGLGRNKIKKLNLENKIELLAGDSETINYQNSSFDAITVAFGVRNFEHLEKGLTEMLRVLKAGRKNFNTGVYHAKSFIIKRFL